LSSPFILLVEDDANDEALMIHALRTRDVRTPVVVARDGVEAVGMLFGGDRSEPGVPDPPLPHVVLLDLNLPRIGGLEILERIRANDRTALLPVVILSSSGEERDLTAGYRLGANSYVVKPIDFEALLDVVGGLGVYWTRINRSLAAHAML